jgi:hypothetical protein
MIGSGIKRVTAIVTLLVKTVIKELHVNPFCAREVQKNSSNPNAAPGL